MLNDPAFVYVVSCDGRTKIGLADNVQKRVRGIRHAVGVEVMLNGCREFPTRSTAAAAERRLHKQFQASRLLGEWFSATPAECVAALEELEVETIVVKVADGPTPEPDTSYSDFIYETALAMAQGRAKPEDVEMATKMIDAR